MSTTAGAASPAGYEDMPYVSGMALYEVPDSARSSEIGWGFQFTGGMPLHDHRYSIELSYYDVNRRRNIDQKRDYQQALLVNGVRDFGFVDWMYLHPYVLGGIGTVHDDVRGDARFNPGIDLGAGALMPIGFYGWAVRLEAVAIGSYNTGLGDGEDKNTYVDYHVTLGLQAPFGLRAKPAVAQTPPAPQQVAQASCAEAVDPITGKKSCISDSDHDGVPDDIDQCPGTPAGVAVDYKGCPVAIRDSDGDGVPDEADACPGTLPGVKVDARGCAVEQTVVVPDINFAYASAKLDDKSSTVLDNIADMMKSQPDLHADIGGHTDNNVHFPEKNRLLSQRRAEVVRDYLVAHGVEASRLTATGYGDANPIASNDTVEGRAQNRRVEFKFSHPQPQQP
jgi:OOP family OmpA-OmpF porin